MTLLAFHIWDKGAPSNEEASHEIVFAETESKAKYASEAYDLSGQFTDIVSKRTPEFDKYAKQRKVPMDIMIEHGWMFECEGCLRYADDNGLIVNNEIYCENCKEKIFIEEGKVYWE